MDQHKIAYKLLNNSDRSSDTVRHWDVEVPASPEELQTFANVG